MLRGILFVVIDCLRADHVSCYGYEHPTTPALDKLAARSMLWERAHSASCATRPSVTSLFTGLYPTQHGAFQHIRRRATDTTAITATLSPTQPTLAETLTNAGWNCGAFINNMQLGEFTGLGRGFSTYIPNAGQADSLTDLFLKWVQEASTGPFFAYLHYLDAHWPYKPRRRHVSLFGGDRDTNVYREFRGQDFAQLRRMIRDRQCSLEDHHVEQIGHLYDGAIRRLDGTFRRVLSTLRKLELEEQMAIIVTADHGEEFMEHGRIGHGQTLLYDEVTHVPLIVHVPGGPAGVRYDEPISHVDLGQTVLGIAGIANGTLPGTDLLAPDAEPRTVCSETVVQHTYAQVIRAENWKLHRRFAFEWEDAPPDSTRSPRAWVADRPNTLSHELYDLASDPGEHDDVADKPEHGDVRSRLEADLDQWWQELPSTNGDAAGAGVEIDQRVIQRLEDLGYIE